MVRRLIFLGDFCDGPFKGCPESFDCHRATGLANGRQPRECPVLRTVLLQLENEEAVRQHDQVHVPGLALAIAKLTTSHPQTLLSVPMECLSACPPTSITSHDASDFPSRAVGHENLARLRISAVVPEYDDPHFLVRTGNANATCEVPLAGITPTKFLAALASDRSCKLVETSNPSSILHFAVELHVADVGARLTVSVTLRMYVVQDIIDSDHTLVVIARAGILLQQLEASFVELLGIPIHLGEKAIQAGLVCRLRELRIHPIDRLSCRNHQAREVLHEVCTLWITRKTVREIRQRLFDYFGKINNRGHGRDLHDVSEPCLINANSATKIHMIALLLQPFVVSHVTPHNICPLLAEEATKLDLKRRNAKPQLLCILIPLPRTAIVEARRVPL